MLTLVVALDLRVDSQEHGLSSMNQLVSHGDLVANLLLVQNNCVLFLVVQNCVLFLVVQNCVLFLVV